MKTLKKALSLVLALAMIFGMTTFASAAYTDAAQITDKEAVEVMTAVGVFNGISGAFQPAANLTRAQAAKLIAYLALGEDVAEALPAIGIFKDVDNSHWAAKYIAYLYNEGVVAGVGAGKFNPNGNVTGYEFGKMLLGCLGYDAANEGMVGTAWAVNTAKLMKSAGIVTTKTAKVAGNALTREAAARYCLNALKAICVEYKTAATVITVAGVEVKTGASAATKVVEVSGTSSYAAAMGNSSYQQLGEVLYEGKLWLSTGLYDDLYRSVNTWYFNTIAIANVAKNIVGQYSATPNYTYTIASKAAKGSSLNTILTSADYLGLTCEDDYYAYKNAASADKNVTTLFDYGDTIEVYCDATTGQVKKVVILRESAAQITKVVANTGKSTVSINGVATVYNYSVYVDTDLDGTYNVVYTDLTLPGYTSEFVKGAYLNIVAKGTAIYASKIASTVTGAVTTYNGTNEAVATAVTVEGTKYTATANVADRVYAASASIDWTSGKYTAILNDAGYLMGLAVEEANEALLEDVVFVVGDAWTEKTTSKEVNAYTVYRQVITATGEIKDVAVGGFTRTNNNTYTKVWGNVTTAAAASAKYIVNTEDTVGVTSASITADGVAVLTENVETGSVKNGATYYTFRSVTEIGNGSTYYAASTVSNTYTATASRITLSGGVAYTQEDSTTVLVKVADGYATKTASKTGKFARAVAADENNVVIKKLSNGTYDIVLAFEANSSIDVDTTVAYVKSATTTQNGKIDGAVVYTQTIYALDGTSQPVNVTAGTKGEYGFVTYTVDENSVYKLNDEVNRAISSERGYFDKTNFATAKYYENVLVKACNDATQLSIYETAESTNLGIYDIPTSKMVVVDLRTADEIAASSVAKITDIEAINVALDTEALGTNTKNLVLADVKVTEDGVAVMFIKAVGNTLPAGLATKAELGNVGYGVYVPGVANFNEDAGAATNVVVLKWNSSVAEAEYLTVYQLTNNGEIKYAEESIADKNGVAYFNVLTGNIQAVVGVATDKGEFDDAQYRLKIVDASKGVLLDEVITVENGVVGF